MLLPRHLITSMVFTRNHVLTIRLFFSISFEVMVEWHGRYHIHNEVTVYLPGSVIAAALSGIYENHLSLSDLFKGLKAYFNKNFDGLRKTGVCGYWFLCK